MIIPMPWNDHHSSHSYSFFLVVVDWNSSIAALSLGITFILRIWLVFLFLGVTIVSISMPWKISLPSQVLTLWSALRATYWTNILNNLERFFPVTYHSIFLKQVNFIVLSSRNHVGVAYQLETSSNTLKLAGKKLNPLTFPLFHFLCFVLPHMDIFN